MSSSRPLDDACLHEHERPAQSPFSERTFERAAAIFRAAGDPARLRMLELMSRGEVCVSELAAASAEAMSTISQRLRLLRSEGLVQRRRDGRHVYYSLTDEHVAELVQNALAHASEADR